MTTSKSSPPTSESRQGGDRSSEATDDALDADQPLSGPSEAAEAAVGRQYLTIEFPLIGRLRLPSVAHLAYYGGVAALVGLEMIDWPLALVLVVGKMLSDNGRDEALRDFGEALEAAG